MASPYYCKWCGTGNYSRNDLMNNRCEKNPRGDYHEPYDGSEKSQYECKYCGVSFQSI